MTHSVSQVPPYTPMGMNTCDIYDISSISTMKVVEKKVMGEYDFAIMWYYPSSSSNPILCALDILPLITSL